jgi:hypothetical protein
MRGTGNKRRAMRNGTGGINLPQCNDRARIDLVELLKASHERSGVNTKNACSVSFVLSGSVQHITNITVFEFVQRGELIAGWRQVVGGKRFVLQWFLFMIPQFLRKVGRIDLRFLA